MNILAFRPHESARVEHVANTLEAMQALVGGYIELVFLPDGYIAVANEEGIMQDLDPSVRIGGQLLVGTVFITKIDPADPENFAGLTDSDIAAAQQWVQPIIAVP